MEKINKENWICLKEEILGKNNTDDYVSYLLQQDEVSIVLKSHLSLEQELDKLIEKSAIRPKHILKFSFDNKIKYLNSIDAISEEIAINISMVNKIRNKFSHNYKYHLLKTDIDLIRQINPAITKKVKTMFIEYFKDAPHKNLPTEEVIIFLLVVERLKVLLMALSKSDNIIIKNAVKKCH